MEETLKSLHNCIIVQGNLVRKLKADDTEYEVLMPELLKLGNLKNEYNTLKNSITL